VSALEEQPERTTETRRLADAIRAVIERFVATSAPVDVFAGVTDELERIAADLDAYPQEPLYFGFAEAANAGNAAGPFEHSPLMGRSNPLAPPLSLDVDGDRVVGAVRFGSAYEGPPGHVHGGYVAAIFDELLGLTQSLSGRHGMTGRLVVHYRAPTPLHTELSIEGRIVDVRGRKITCTGTLHAGDTLLAEAEGLFISVDFGRLAALRERREAERRGTPGRDAGPG
jgi:acyl-coenzyme A thioesterase PaaI-like protein